MTWRTSLRPLSSIPFRYLFFGRLADNVAHAVAPIALAFAVLDLGGSAGDLGLVLAARTIPLVVLVLLGGVIADRLPRHLVLVVANVVAAGTQGLVAVLLLTGTADIWTIAAIEMVNGAASAFLFPAASGLTPQTVPASDLQPANALLRLAHNASFITGAAGGGLLVAAAGSGWAFAIDAALYLVSAVLLARIRLPKGDRVPAQDVLSELREGWAEFTSRTWVWVIVVAFSVVNLAYAAGFVTLGPVVADETIGRAAWGLVLAAQAAGMFAGGLIALRSTWRRPLRVGTTGVLLVAPMLLALGLRPETAVLLGLAFLTGVGLETFTVAWDVSMQSNIPQDRLSRVYAYDWFGSLLFIPVGQALAGPLAAGVGQDNAIVACGAVAFAATLVALAVPSVRNLQAQGLDATPAATAEPVTR
jgi:MFS family permease